METRKSRAKVKRARPTAAGGTTLVPIERVERSILMIRGQKVLMDADLAVLFGVPVKRLNEAVKRNIHRFPADFMFQLTQAESEAFSRSQFATLNEPQALRSQIVTLKPRRGSNIKYLPYAFTEHGAVMLASVLRSPTAVAVSVQVVRAFIRLRQMIASNDKLRRKLSQIEGKLRDHDQNFAAVFDAIRQLMDEQETEGPEKSRIGYDTEISDQQ